MLYVRKILLDILLSGLLLVLSAVLAVPIKMQNPDCVTCAVIVANTFWFAFVIALQPVLWAVGISKRQRLLIWLAAVISGALIYFLLELVGDYLFSTGNSIGLTIGLYANIAFEIVALAISILGVKHTKSKNVGKT